MTVDQFQTNAGQPQRVSAHDDGVTIMDNLDEFERGETYALYAFAYKGRRIALIDPAELDWQDLAALRDEQEFLKLAMVGEGDLKFFTGSGKVPAWKIRELMDRYFRHYGIEDEEKPRG